MSLYDSIALLPPDPIFGLGELYQADTRPDKLTLVTGYYRDQDLKVPLLDTVAQVEKRIAEQKLCREYLPIEGDSEYIRFIGELVFGGDYDETLIFGLQTVGGTGALRECGNLIRTFSKQIFVSDYTWANHRNIFKGARLDVFSYPYYANKKLLFEEMLKAFEGLEKGTPILLHANSHNPTGLDLSEQQWKEVAALVKNKELYPVIDMAYQGFSKEPHEDAFGARLFFDEGIEFALTYTCSKNFSLYGERAGALFFVLSDSKWMENVKSQVKASIRQSYSEPPVHSAEIVKGILKDAALKAHWLEELSQMRQRLYKVREDFVSLISHKDPEGNWDNLKNGTGPFCNTELSAESVEKLRVEKGIYTTGSGRINLTCLNLINLERVVDAILSVSK